MHLDFRTGPVEHRAPSQEVWILHLLEGILDVVLRTVGQPFKETLWGTGNRKRQRRPKLQGTVVALIEIWPDGLVRNPKIKKGLGLDQDEKDLEALEQRKFKTGMKTGSQPRSRSRPRSVSV